MIHKNNDSFDFDDDEDVDAVEAVMGDSILEHLAYIWIWFELACLSQKQSKLSLERNRNDNRR